MGLFLKHEPHPHGWNDCGIRDRAVGAENLQIARELEPRREMEVVKHFDLVLDSKTSTQPQQIEIVL